MSEADTLITGSESIGDGVVLSLGGEIDYSRAPTLRGELMAVVKNKAPQRLVLDLAGVDYMDSSGVATLVETLSMQRNAKSKLVLCNLQQRVRGIFEIARLDKVFTIADSRDDALKA